MRRLLFGLVIIFITAFSAYSQTVVTIQSVPPQYNVNTDEFPLLKLNVRVTDGGSPVELLKNQFYILEEAMVCEPIEVTPISGGWQTVKWYTKLTDFTKVGQENKDYFGQLLTVYKNLPDRKLIVGSIDKLPVLFVVAGSNDQQMRDANWEIVTPGNSIPFQMKLKGYLQSAKDFKQTNIKIDSLTTKTKYFTWKWLGPLIGEKREPPAELGVGIEYLVNIYFTPDKFGYFQDVLTIHFNNGMKKYIPLYGNSFSVDVQKLIELTEPKPGTAFSPCQEVTIKWKGQSVEYPVELYYSIDAGYEWRKIDVVRDSMYVWRIPDIETNFLMFKVRQDFQNSKTSILSEDQFPVFSVNYNTPGTLLSSFNSMGKVMTWDLTTQPSPTFLRRHYIEEITEESQEKFYSFGLEYSNTDNKFYISYRNLLVPPFLQRDTIAVFNADQTYPVKKIVLPQGFRTNKILSDRTKTVLTVFPAYGNKLLQYSMIDESFIREYAFEAPIMDISFSTTSDSAAVLLINGRIKLVRLTDFAMYDELNFDIFPNFLKIAYSPNGKMLSIGGQSDGSGLKTNSYLIDIATRQIVKVFTPSSGNSVAMQFNPTSTSVIVGSETDKQIALYDLASTVQSSNLFGHSENMTDMKMSPGGLSIVSTSLAKQDNMVYRTFTYPQEDAIDAYLIIERPKITLDIVKIEPEYLGTDNPQNVTTICNIGRSLADIFDARFKLGTHFNLQTQWQRDTLYPNNCYNIGIYYSPLDTGIIRDTLILYHCSKQYWIPFESYSKPRNLALLSNNFDFGEVCIGDTLSKELAIFRNDDPVPLKLNNVVFKDKEDLYFSKSGIMKDTIIEAGGTFYAKLNFVPKDLGAATGELLIIHSNQSKIFASMNVKGTGIGSFIEVSHDALRFIPEITTREIKMKNIGATDISFEQFRVVPAGNFDVLTPAGFILKPNEDKIVQVQWKGIDETPAQLVTDANPCLVQKFIPLTFYRGSSIVKVPTVMTEANNEFVKIPITYSNTENGVYNGKRIFEADFEVNYKLFLPRTVESKFGPGSITHNSVNNGIRTFGIKVEGDFTPSDTVAVIVGVAGLSNIDRSPISITNNSIGWSKFVNMTSEPGEIIITGICEDRYIIRTQSIIKDLVVIPNPVSAFAKISFHLVQDADINCDLIDNTGCTHKLISEHKGNSGNNLLDLNLSQFGTGNYKLRISSGSEFITRNLIILR
jgi:WD40 repeat protein